MPTTSEFLLWLSILLGGSIILASFIKRLNIPSILGFIVIGILLGPSGFKIITEQDLIKIFADLGIVILLFTIGLGFNLKRLRELSSKIIIIGASQQLFMFMLGLALSYILGWKLLESLYIGAILSITSTAVLLKLLQDHGIIHTKEGSTVIGISIIEDLISILILVVLGGLASSTINVVVVDVLILISKMISFFIITLVLGLKIIPKVANSIDKLNLEEADLLISLALGFGLAALASYLGLSIAIGAFIMGVIISTAAKSELITNKLMPLNNFFGTLFFISIGMLIDVGYLPRYLLSSIPLLLIAIIGKFVANYTLTRVVGYNRLSSSTIGVLMIPRGEISFIIAKQGEELGVKGLLPLTMLLSLETMVAMPLILRIFPTIMDARTIFSARVFDALDLVGYPFRFLLKKVEGKDYSHTFINLSILLTIVAIYPILDSILNIFYETFTILKIIQYEIFKMIFIVILTSYPLLNIFRNNRVTISIERISKIVKISTNLDYRFIIIRDIVIIVSVLLTSSYVIQTFYLNYELKILLFIFAIGIFVYLAINTYVIIHRKVEELIIDTLFKEEKRG